MVSSKFQRVISLFWLVAIVLCIAAFAMAWVVQSNVETERQVYKDKVELIEAGSSLAKASDYLTAEARNFSVLGDFSHLQNYWDEVFIRKNRDKAIQTLERLGDQLRQVELLLKSKRNSDALIATELRSMRLVLEAYEVPQSLMPDPVDQFVLSHADKKLSKADKVRLAQKILFDEAYYKNKASIMKPIAQFKQALRNLAIKQAMQARKVTNRNLLILKILLFLLVLTIVGIIWVRSTTVAK